MIEITHITLTYWQVIGLAFAIFFVGYDIARRQR